MLLGLLPHSACASSADFDCYFLVQYSYILLFIAKNSHTFKYFYGVGGYNLTDKIFKSLRLRINTEYVLLNSEHEQNERCEKCYEV